MTIPKLPILIFALAVLTCFSAPAPAAEQGDAANADKVADEKESDEKQKPLYDGILLGEFYLKDFRPISGQKTKFTFTIYAVVETEEKKRLQPIFERRAKRIKDQVITAVRLSEDKDFEDPRLNRMRRRITFRLQRAMPELEFSDVYFTDFRYYVD